MVVRLAINWQICNKREFKDLLYEHRDRFSNTLGCTDLVEHRIKVNSENPTACKLSPLPDGLKQQVEEQITELYEQGHIEEADSSAHPIVCVKKRGTDTIRLCCHLRAINSITISDEYPMADLTELIDTAAGARHVSTINLKSAYHQIKMVEDSKHFTCFRSFRRHWVWNKMCFGLKNVSKTFQRQMDKALRGAEKIC